MRNSVTTFEDRLHRRFCYLAAEAGRHARTDREAREVLALGEAVRCGMVGLRAAHEALTALRSDQRTEREAA